MSKLEQNVQEQFQFVLNLITKANTNIYKSVNTEIIDLYWNIGEYLTKKTSQNSWGKEIVKQLSGYIQTTQANIKGFSPQNLWRMKQFYETYYKNQKLSTLLREIPWSHNMAIIGSAKNDEEREFYIRLVNKERLSFRELQRQIDSSCFERVMIGNTNLSTLSREIKQPINNIFKDTYVLEMLQLPMQHSEKDLKHKIAQNISLFLLEFGRDFSFIGEEYPLQVGKQDFAIDLLFYHRALQCLVAIELKTEKFKPAHLGQLNFYLEALDQTVKKNTKTQV